MMHTAVHIINGAKTNENNCAMYTQLLTTNYNYKWKQTQDAKRSNH